MITCYYCKGKHELVSQVKDCAKIPAAFAAKVETGKIVETVIPATVVKVAVPAHRTSAAYLALKAKVAPVAETPAPAVVKTIDQQIAEHDAALAVIKKGQDLEIGMYQVGDDIFKIDWNKSKTYKMASKLVISQKEFFNKNTNKWEWAPKGKFWYVSGMMNKLTSENKMDEAAAKAFHDATKAKYGQEYGFCCVCGKLLTNQKSVAKGIGPVCEKYF